MTKKLKLKSESQKILINVLVRWEMKTICPNFIIFEGLRVLDFILLVLFFNWPSKIIVTFAVASLLNKSRKQYMNFGLT